MTRAPSRLSADIDFDKEGKQTGFVRLPLVMKVARQLGSPSTRHVRSVLGLDPRGALALTSAQRSKYFWTQVRADVQIR